MIIAIIATFNREDLLVSRAVLSIAKQSKPPNLVIIVNDSATALSVRTKQQILKLLENKTEVLFLTNNRTQGAAGAWNCAIAYCAAEVSKQTTFLAILDDDDQWLENHIETCAQYVTSHQLIVSGLIRSTTNLPFEQSSDITKEPIPSQLIETDFLLGNPGIQGSNVFIELELMLQVGMFNEHMICSTDRDLCIRLSELSPRVISTNKHTVLHYAESDRERLTIPTHPKRKEGMQRFFDSYLPRMSQAVQNKSLARATKLFDFFYETPVDILTDELTQAPDNTTVQLNLTVGVICGNWLQVEPLLTDLLALQGSGAVKSLSVILLENSSVIEPAAPYEAVIKNFHSYSQFVSKSQQLIDAKNQLFSGINDRNAGQVSIAKARTMLQTYCYYSSQKNQDVITWILDDDMRIHHKVYQYLPWLNVFKQQGVDALIGNYEGGSPNPSLNALRVQLNDLNHNLRWLAQLCDEDLLPNKESINIKTRQLYPDFYYDLSNKNFGNLEAPIWITPAHNGETVAHARSRLLDNVDKIITGEAYLRPLISRWPEDPINDAIASSNRGGHTFIFNHQLLANTPNPSLHINGIDLRRSDMLWALINRKVYGANIKFVNFPIYHDRITNGKCEFDLTKAISEVQGAAIYQGLSMYLEQYKVNSDISTQVLEQLICSQLSQRLAAYTLNFNRIQGLLICLRKYNHFPKLNRLIYKINNSLFKEELGKAMPVTSFLSDAFKLEITGQEILRTVYLQR